MGTTISRFARMALSMPGKITTRGPARENMRLAVAELLRYGKSFLPSASFTTYVPPSNYLSEEGQQVVLRTVPTVTTISGLYLPEMGVNALVQEFEEEEDGSISVPRITSGFAMDGYNELVAAHELMLHGVFSHFIHPDDVLDDDGRGSGLDEHVPELHRCPGTDRAGLPRAALVHGDRRRRSGAAL